MESFRTEIENPIVQKEIIDLEKKIHLFKKYLKQSADFIEYKNSLIEYKRLSHGK